MKKTSINSPWFSAYSVLQTKEGAVLPEYFAGVHYFVEQGNADPIQFRAIEFIRDNTYLYSTDSKPNVVFIKDGIFGDHRESRIVIPNGTVDQIKLHESHIYIYDAKQRAIHITSVNKIQAPVSPEIQYYSVFIEEDNLSEIPQEKMRIVPYGGQSKTKHSIVLFEKGTSLMWRLSIQNRNINEVALLTISSLNQSLLEISDVMEFKGTFYFIDSNKNLIVSASLKKNTLKPRILYDGDMQGVSTGLKSPVSLGMFYANSGAPKKGLNGIYDRKELTELADSCFLSAIDRDSGDAFMIDPFSKSPSSTVKNLFSSSLESDSYFQSEDIIPHQNIIFIEDYKAILWQEGSNLVRILETQFHAPTDFYTRRQQVATTYEYT